MKNLLRAVLVSALIVLALPVAAREAQTIDILVAFTSEAAARIEESGAAINSVGTSNLQEFAQRAVSRTNAALDKSGLHDRFLVADVYRTRSETGRGDEHHLRRLLNPNDGVFDDVHAERERLGADVVALVYSARQSPFECGMVLERPNQTGSNEARAAFSVVHWLRALDPNNDCFAHEAGHLLGATHENAECGNILFSGRNYSDRRSIMAHPSPQCPLSLPFYSWPNVLAMSRHVAIVAGYRTSAPEPEPEPVIHRHALPYVPGPSLVRIINQSDHAGDVRIHGIDDAGERFGPITLSLDGHESQQFSTRQLETGLPSRGLDGGLGDGKGAWQILLDTSLDIQALAYRRVRGGLTTIHATIPEVEGVHHVPLFYPASHPTLFSTLRIVNPNDEPVSVTITGRDDRGMLAPDEAQLTIAPGVARMLSATWMDRQLGDEAARWQRRQIFITADRVVWVMNLLRSTSGIFTSLSAQPSELMSPELPVQMKPPPEPAMLEKSAVPQERE